MKTSKLTTQQVQVQAWALEHGVGGKLAKLSQEQMKGAAADLSLPIEQLTATVQELQKTTFSDANQARESRLLKGDLNAATETRAPQREVFGISSKPPAALAAFKKLVLLNNDVVKTTPWDRSTRHDAQSVVREVFKHDLSADEQKAARLWLASAGGGWALEAVSRSPVAQLIDGVWSSVADTDYSKAPTD